MTAPMSAALKAHYALGTTSVTTLLKITRADGVVRALTSHQEDIVYDGVTYKALAAYSPTAVSSSSDLSPDNLEVQSFYSALSISADDVRTGVWDYADVEILEVNFRDLSQGHKMPRKGKLGELRGERSLFNAELRGLTQRLSRRIVKLLTATCPYDLGDADCKVALAPFTVAGSITSDVSSNRLFTDSARAEADNWFTGGQLTWLTGANAGLRMEVRRSTSAGVIELQQQMPFPMAVGDTYSVYKGCAKRPADCKEFSNYVNFGGFPDLPGHDVYKGPQQ